ncbi:MAG: ATP-binding protein [Cyanobacteria bacterium P01_A01_bin.105]
MLALGTAIIGTGIGLSFGYSKASPARRQLQQNLRHQQLVSDFNNQLLKLQLHPTRLLAIAGKSNIWVEYETNQFKTDLRQLEHLLDELEQIDLIITPELSLQQLTTDYRQAIATYEQFTSELWTQLDGVQDQTTARTTLSLALSSNQANQLSTDFEKQSENLIRLQQNIDRRYQQGRVRFQQAEQLRLFTILTSMVVSIGLAVALAAITSRTIAQPIEQLTKVARRVTQNSDFQLQATIDTQDEVALLAQALNQLVSWAGQYTTELEIAQHHLEERVEQRTQALQKSEASLRQQTLDLQQALNDRQQAQLKLVQSEKMSSLGQMVAGIAHEINNPVSFIHGNLQHAITYTEDVLTLIEQYQVTYPEPGEAIQILLDDIDLPFVKTDFPKLVASMGEGTARIRDIVKSLRTFSRLDEAAVKPVDLHEGLDSTLTILGHRLKATETLPAIQIHREYGTLPLVECHAGQLNQVFMNILSNAVDALRTGRSSAPPAVTITTQHHAPSWVVIHIKDNGPGIPETAIKRLFDPFFTTKPVGQGTGMGLSISYQIMTQTHRGQLWCNSDPGQGAEFILKLPVTSQCRVRDVCDDGYTS